MLIVITVPTFTPYESFFTALGAAHVVLLHCFLEVAFLGSGTNLTGVIAGDFVAMGPTVVFVGCVSLARLAGAEVGLNFEIGDLNLKIGNGSAAGGELGCC
jgi:hypothetical protein